MCACLEACSSYHFSTAVARYSGRVSGECAQSSQSYWNHILYGRYCRYGASSNVLTLHNICVTPILTQLCNFELNCVKFLVHLAQHIVLTSCPVIAPEAVTCPGSEEGK